MSNYDREYYLKNRDAILSKSRKDYVPRKRLTNKWTNSYSPVKGEKYWHLTISKTDPEGNRKYYQVKLDAEDVETAKRLNYRLDKNLNVACWSYEDQETTFTFLHRYIVDPKPHQKVGFINKNTLDCRKSNLSICENMSCIMLNSIRRTFGIECHDGAVYLRRHGRLYTLYKEPYLEKRHKLAKKLRGDEPAQKRLLYEFNRTKNGKLPLFGVHRKGDGWGVEKFQQYWGYFKSLPEALRVRDKLIKKHVDAIWNGTPLPKACQPKRR